ncbi:CRTAC1 family protein [Steroidobacter flavus]|uniref:CRTAC1 family protein n=1 Tax=Steroidobacter flavus TaxID=1842136 RepID=A0ABV8SXX7_9GAMM
MTKQQVRHLRLALALMAAGPSASSQGSTVDAFTPVQPETFATPGAFSNAWADFDADGDADLAVSFRSGAVRLYRNDHGSFKEVGAQLGLPTEGPEARALAWGDFDGDGDPDLYVGAKDRGYLFRNDRAKGFNDVAAELGIAPGAITSRHASWIDYDNDGDLDLHIANRSGANLLFRNDGSRFVETAAALGLADQRRTVGACWFDMDQDGDLDLFLANQGGDTDALYRNDAGKFSDIAGSLGVASSGRDSSEGGVGCTVGDYDNDGDLDFFVAMYGVSRLYRNDGGAFKDVGGEAGVAVEGHAVSASWGDYDNDGDLDLYVTDYHKEGEVSRPASHLFRNDGGRFSNVLGQDSPLNAADHGVQWADFDSDGDLDVALTQGYSTDAGEPVFRNEMSPQARGRSMQVAVVDWRGRATRVGSEVRVFDPAGRLLGTQIVSSGDGYNAQSAMPVRFGFIDAKRVTVEVTYLTPRGRRQQRLENVKPAQWVSRPLRVRER